MELRPYQTASIDALRDNFRAGMTRQVLCASTGAGKSVMAVELIRACAEKKTRVMFVCDRRVLVEQFSRHLWANEIHHGIIMRGHPNRRYEPVQVCSVQTLERCESWINPDLMIVDEIHAVMRESLIGFMQHNPQTKIIGLTATPYHAKLKEHFQGIVNVVTMKELVDTGFLVPFRVFAATEPNMEGVKVVAGEWQREETEKRGLQIIGDVIADYQKIVNSVFSGNPQKTIVFSSGVGHGAELVKRFASIGLNFVQISYLDSEEYKTDVLKEFSKKSSSIDGVISTDILTRGFDQPDVAHVVVAKPLRKSFSQHVQMIGRGARPYAGKEFCVIQDNSGNWLRFADSFDELYHDGVKTLDSDADKRTRKEKTEKEKKEARCPQCMQVWTGKVQVCPTCGFMREKKNKKEEVAGVLTELEFGNKTKKEQTQHKEWWYKQLLQYSRGKGYQDGWAYYAFNDKFGHFPHGYKKDTAPVGLECYNWITARNIRNSKRRKQA